VRGLVQLSGWVTPVPEDDVARLVLDFADTCPCDSLFDVGLSATLVRLDLAEVLLEEAGISTDVEPEDFLGARPDGVSAVETELMAAERGPLDRLTRRVQQWAGRHDEVRLVGWTASASGTGWRAAAVATTSVCRSRRRCRGRPRSPPPSDTWSPAAPPDLTGGGTTPGARPTTIRIRPQPRGEPQVGRASTRPTSPSHG